MKGIARFDPVGIIGEEFVGIVDGFLGEDVIAAGAGIVQGDRPLLQAVTIGAPDKTRVCVATDETKRPATHADSRKR